MSVFTDYAAKMRQLKTPFNTPAQMQPISTPSFAPVAVEQPQQPQVDTGNAIGSIAEMLGPTPAEREARERRAQESRAKMSAWAGLFDGLRQFGNLYYAYKGATPQQLSSPYQAIDHEINQQRAIADANDNYRRQYAQSLYNIRRQISDDARRDILAKAQADYYGTRDEVARMKAENDRLRNEQNIATQKARQAQIETKTEQMKNLYPLEKQKLEAVIKKYNHDAGRPYGRSRGGGSGKYDPYEDIATLLNDSPDVIGPILQQEGLGYYDTETKNFTFKKSATSGMAKIAARRARRQGNGGSSGSAKSKVSIRN